jgi:hypothetical protein
MELALKRLDGVDRVVISIERQQFVVLYKPNAGFQPILLREAVSQAGVDVVQFHIQARGKVEKQAGGNVFVSGKDKYALTADSKPVPPGTEVVIGGDVVNDRKLPYQLKIIDFKPAGGAATSPAASKPTTSKNPAK